MKVLLIQDVDNLGYAGDVKKVANGFGRNYLLPQELAVLATPGALKQAETIRKAAEKHRAKETEDAQAISGQISGLELAFERRAGETGKLYGSVTSGDIATAITEKTEIEIDKRKVSLPEPIRALGKQEVTIKLMIDVSTSVNVEVLPLGGILERERLSQVEVDKIEAEASGEEVEETAVTEESVTEGSVTEESVTEESVAEESPAEETAVAEESPAEEAEVAEESPAEEAEFAAESPAEETAVAAESPTEEAEVAEESPTEEAVVAEEESVAEETPAEAEETKA